MQFMHRFLNINEIGFTHCEVTIYSNKMFELNNDLGIQYLSSL